MTRSNDEDSAITRGDHRSPGQQSHNLDQRDGSDHFNPNLEPDFEGMSPEAQAAISKVSYGRPTATLAPAKPKRKRASAPGNLLKELAAFNKDSIIETDPSIIGLNLREAHNTRRFVRSVSNIAAGSNTPIPPLDNLNFRNLQDEQLKVAKRGKKNYVRSTSTAGSYKSEENREKDDEDFCNRPMMSDCSPRKVSGVRNDQDTTEKEGMRQRRLRAEGKDVWKLWSARKDKILNLIRDPSFPGLRNTDEEQRQDLGPIVPDNLNMFMEDDFFVFAPTAAELWNFPNFIAKVEDITGRKRGFVKIILPDAMKSSYCPPHPTVTASSSASLSFNGSSNSIRPYKTGLDTHEPFKSKMVIYRVRMLGAVNVLISEWQEVMRRYQEEIMKRQSQNPIHIRDDVLNEVPCIPRNEEEMIADSKRASDDMYCTADIQESHSLRQALQIGGPYLRSIHGNSLQVPSLKELAMASPEIQLAGAKGSPFGLTMTNHAAYSLNYLHRGAPKRWIIIEPDAHKQLEELLYPQVESIAERLIKNRSSGFKSPTHPPRCDRFLNHQSLYVPKETLILHGIAHTELVQYEGEMVITFPFAYCQGFSAGPNVAEAIAFGNDRWETIHKSGLYRPCHANCSGPKGPATPGQVEFPEVDQPSHDLLSRHVPETEFEEGDNEDSSPTTPESSDTDEEVSDPEDGTWEDPSVNNRSKIQKRTTRQTPIKSSDAYPRDYPAYSPSKASNTTRNTVAGAKSDEKSEEDFLMRID